jgi:hypothetical protein
VPLIFKIPKMNDFLVSTSVSTTKPYIGSMVGGPGCFTVGNKGVYYSKMGRRDDEMAYVYHSEKRRRRFTKGMIGKGRKAVEGKIKTVEATWSTRVFAIPLARIKNVKQHSRHFVVELLK